MTPRIKVRVARRDDEEALVRFLQEHWRENHVFFTDPELIALAAYGPQRFIGADLRVGCAKRKRKP